MKGRALILLCALAIAHAESEGFYDNGCPIDSSKEKLMPHENCNQFYQCSHGVLIARFCPSGLHYNHLLDKCDWVEEANCHSKRRNYNNNQEHDELDNNNLVDVSSICAAPDSNGILVAHENCNEFYKCSYGKPVVIKCAENLLYNPLHEKCDYPYRVDCDDRFISITENTFATLKRERNEDAVNSNEAVTSNDTVTSNDGMTSNDVTISNDVMTANDAVISTDDDAVNSNEAVTSNDTVTSNDGMTSNDVTISNDVMISNDAVTSDDDNEIGNFDPSQAPAICAAKGSDGVLVAHDNCNLYYKCFRGKPVIKKCPVNLLYNPSKEYCDWHRNVDCGDRPVSENDYSQDSDKKSGEASGSYLSNSEPRQAAAICAVPNSNGVLVAHQFCNQFYKCSGGLPVAFHCPGSLLYNPSKNRCDWPHSVDCDNRIQLDGNDSDDNDNSSPQLETRRSHCDPSQATAICAAQGSDGVLVAHENCNQFYKCYEGHPVELRCPGNLLYNPIKEYCDWPNYVDCKDRLILVEAYTNSNENNEIENADDFTGTGNNYCDPKEARKICAAENSNGMLVAHENCNQFYKCFEGKPLALFCQLNLLYNPSKEYCDWPQNVNCGSRVIPNVNNTNEDDESNTNYPTFSCVGRPDGSIIPHGNCSQFYKCDNGKMYPMECPPGLYFNAESNVCDWPVNVDCGDRLTESQILNKDELARRTHRFVVPLH